MIKQFVTEEFCLKCRGCCHFSGEDSVWGPALLKEERGDKLFAKAATCEGKITLLKNSQEGDFVCPFFNPGINQCKIYPSRPFECQLYPFLINRQGNKAFLAADLNCPFLKEGFQTSSFKEYVSFLAGYLNSPSFREVFGNNPGLAQKYEGVSSLCELSLIL